MFILYPSPVAEVENKTNSQFSVRPTVSEAASIIWDTQKVI